MAAIFPVEINDKPRLVYLPTEKIIPCFSQPRKSFDEAKLYELAASIKENGILQPITVRKKDGEKYEIVAGERRFRAARLVGLSRVPCIIRSYTDEQAFVLSVIENIQRNNLTFFEEAMSFEKLIRDYGYTQEEVAAKVGKTQSAVANKLRLLKLDENLRSIISENGLTERHARCLLRLNGTELREKAIKEIISGSLNVAQTEALILSYSEEHKKEEKKSGKSRRCVKLFKDMRIFSSTINQTINMIRKTGLPVTADKKETDSFIEYTIRVEKSNSDI